jgi:farnesyl diphosphate synthase
MLPALALTVALLLLVIAASAARTARVRIAPPRLAITPTATGALVRDGEMDVSMCPRALAGQPRTLDQYRALIDRSIQCAAADFGTDPVLAGACLYALDGSKHIRGVIVLEIARCAGLGGLLPMVDATETVLFIEYLHAASLVVDDLPIFDNDAVRHGRPSVHVAWGAATAQMAAVALLGAGFQNVCRQVDVLRSTFGPLVNVDRIGMRLCAQIAHSIGAHGAAGGQLREQALAPPASQAQLPLQWAQLRSAVDRTPRTIALAKTATLFELAALAGWVVAGRPLRRADELVVIGRHLGLAYQIADDISDHIADAARGVPNYVQMHGAAAADAALLGELAQARAGLQRLGLWSETWGEIFSLVLQMSL